MLQTCQLSLESSSTTAWLCRPQRQQGAARTRPRALGAALEAALYLARGPAASSAAAPAAPGMGGRAEPRGRVLLLATGPTTKVRRKLGLSPADQLSNLKQQCCTVFDTCNHRSLALFGRAILPSTSRDVAKLSTLF